MIELLVLLGVGLAIGMADGGGGSSGDDLPEQEDLTSEDDGLVSEDYRAELNATYDILVAEGEISRSEADAILDDVQFRSGAINVAAGAGDDEIVGSDQGDLLDAGAGDDLVFGGEGDDAVLLGDGSDAYGVDTRAAVRPDDFEPFPVNVAPLGAESQLEGGDDRVLGGQGDDYIADGFGTNHLNGQAGDDFLISVDQDGVTPDRVVGGSGDDVLIVDEGDSVRLGAGEDRVTVDVFGGLSSDYLTVEIDDFTPGEDVIELEGGVGWLRPAPVLDPDTGQQIGERDRITVFDLSDGTGAMVAVDGIPVVRVFGGQGLTAQDILIST
ncbi:hypothetical protein E4Z66_07760 [Aliishimia ponticola]|uniref:Calcium-binding protein n=1 Tax=Aliishimia ponticola TaxID=2499833 RepID=A0A4V3XKF9_9RHOB|nr:hypothetical protein [Aliishimia ponticola]THH36833.1 hypothetical protein E4Z66_07760 [Aliishimia ponticola]